MLLSRDRSVACHEIKPMPNASPWMPKRILRKAHEACKKKRENFECREEQGQRMGFLITKNINFGQFLENNRVSLVNMSALTRKIRVVCTSQRGYAAENDVPPRVFGGFPWRHNTRLLSSAVEPVHIHCSRFSFIKEERHEEARVRLEISFDGNYTHVVSL